jgi:hypothetical protein
MSEDERAMTDKERAWVGRLKQVLRSMPKTLEVTVHTGGNICVLNEGATARYADLHGHADDPADLVSFTAQRVRPCESSL